VSTSPKIIRDLATREFVLTGPDGFEKRFASSDAVGTPESRFVDKSKILSFPATRAVGVIDYTGQPLNDETFVIGGTTYTFKSSATAGVNTEVQIGVDEDTTYASLTAAVNAVDDQASAVHVPASNRVDLTAAVPGTPGNSVTLTDGASNATITAFAGGVNDEWGSRVYAFRRSIPVATVNSTAGGVILPPIGAMVDPGFAYRILDVKLQVNGTVAGATSIDVTHTPNGFPESTFIWTVAGGNLIAGALAMPDSVSVSGAPFKVGYNGYGVGIKKVGSDITGASYVDVIIQYTIENGWIT
jgi:hypothetical protein